MAILGIMSTDTTGSGAASTSGLRWTNIRRRVFYEYPNGSAPLLGLLSMMKEDEVNDPEFSWWEKRLQEQVTTTVTQGSSKGPFMRANGSTDAGDPVDDGSAGGWVAGTEYTIKVASTALFRPGHIIKARVACNSGASYFDLAARVTAITSTTILKVMAMTTKIQSGGIDNGTTNENVGVEVAVIGSAFPQGVTDLSRECYYFPINVGNYTQIFRTPFSFTGNALITPVKFDDAGIYKDKAKSHSIDHMIEMELAILFGTKYRTTENLNNATVAEPVVTSGSGLPLYTTGGILHFLREYEAIYSVYRGGNGSNSGPAAVTADSSDDKRIIANSAGTMNEATYDTYLERLFRTSSNVSNEKLVLCGSGFLKVMNQMYRSQSTFVYYPPSGSTFGMEIVAHKTAFGTVYYKTHPLFSRNATLRNNALFLDVHNLRYRPMAKRDTQLLKNRQLPDMDGRKDEWFTEMGLELRMPESFMYLQNVTSYIP